MLPKHPLWFRLLRTGPGRVGSRREESAWPVWGQAACGSMPLGRGIMAQNGCEALCARWVLALLGRPVPLEQVVQAYEQGRKLLLWGHLGCDPFALPEVLKLYGLCCTEYTDYTDLCAAMSEDGVFAASYWVTGRLRDGAHGVALCRKNSRLQVFNRHNRQSGPLEISPEQVADAQRFIVGYKII